MKKIERIVRAISKEFLENGNYEAIGSSMAADAVATAIPASTESVSFSILETGFAGLSVQGVGFTKGSTDESVKIYVTKGSKSALSKMAPEVDGVHVDIVNFGRIFLRPEATSGATNQGNFYKRKNRVACGSSCAPAGENYSGTFGALVKKDGALHALSNNHVFAACNHVPVQQPIMSPSSMDARPSIDAPRQICRHSDIIELRSGTPALVPLVKADAAIANVPDGKQVSSWQGGTNGYDTPRNTSPPSSGLEVKKFGRTTGLTNGIVEALIPTPFPLPYKMSSFTATVYLTEIWTIRVADEDEHFALPGDSGSLVVSGDGKHAVGLLFAASSKGDYGFIAPIDTILGELNLQLVNKHGI